MEPFACTLAQLFLPELSAAPISSSVSLAGEGDAAREVLGSPALAYVGAVLALSGIALGPFVAHLARKVFPGRNVIFARWGFTHVARVALVFAAALLLLPQLWPPSQEPAFDELLVRTGLVMAAACGAAVHFARRLSPEGAQALGFRKGRNARALAAGLLSYALLAPGLTGLALFWPWGVELLGGAWEPQEAARGFLTLAGPRAWLAIALAILVLPLLEELLFRGFLQPLLVQNFRDTGGIVLTSLCFAALHGWNAFLPIFGLSLLLGGIMLRTQRLVACWLVHGLHNALAIALLLGSDELRRVALREAHFLPFP